ncbi:MAG: hypothetical protein IJR46_04915 [Neisseriaceae bacterium]|nr:hypothetical protein [Neisseriaceae bacterium]
MTTFFSHLPTLALLIYGALFVFFSLKSRQHQWLMGSLVVALIIGVASSWVLPNILGFTHLPNAFLLHTYLFLASPLFYFTQMRRLPEKKQWQNQQQHVFLTLFANSLLSIHLSFILFAALIYHAYPQGFSVWAGTFLLQLYVSEPLILYALQAYLMLLFYSHRRLCEQRADLTSVPQLEGGLLLMLMWQVAYVYARFLL